MTCWKISAFLYQFTLISATTWICLLLRCVLSACRSSTTGRSGVRFCKGLTINSLKWPLILWLYHNPAQCLVFFAALGMISSILSEKSHRSPVINDGCSRSGAIVPAWTRAELAGSQKSQGNPPVCLQLQVFFSVFGRNVVSFGRLLPNSIPNSVALRDTSTRR